ncbi:hypothetical protein [[Phormidium ambiguum] IAM M-71]|nr:hypothetical protein [Phormidium ambiguum]
MSEYPTLIIQYHERRSLYPIKTFFLIIAMFLTISAFIVACWLAIEPLSALPYRIEQPDFWEFKSGVLYFDENRFSLPGLAAIILGLFAISMILYELVWSILGISEFRAFPEKLMVKHRLFGISRTHLIHRNSLLQFQESRIMHDDHIYGWTLKAITKQRRFFLFHSEIVLLNKKPLTYSDWLGTVLADFYKVKFVPSPARGRI